MTARTRPIELIEAFEAGEVRDAGLGLGEGERAGAGPTRAGQRETREASFRQAEYSSLMKALAFVMAGRRCRAPGRKRRMMFIVHVTPPGSTWGPR